MLPPKNVPPPKPMSLDEFKPLLCPCGEVKRLSVQWTENIVHRFRATMVAEVQKIIYVCLGCGEQLLRDGQVAPPESPDRLSPEMLRKILGREV